MLTWLQLGGLHSNAYITDLFAKAYATEGMKAYVEIIQRRERDIGCDVLTHQKVRLPSSPTNTFIHDFYSGVEQTMQITC